MSVSGKPNLLEDCASITLSNPSKWTINMHSRAGERTGVLINDLKIVIDCGLATEKNIKAVFMTHKHCDHSYMLPMVIKGRSNVVKGQEHLTGRPVYLPAFMKNMIKHQIQTVLISCDDHYDESNGKLEYSHLGMTDDELFKRQSIHPMEVTFGDSFSIPGVKDIHVEVLKAYHTCSCNGYGFSTIKKNVIKEEYRHLLKTEDGRKTIKELINNKINIKEDILIPELAFYCDSTSDNLTKHKEWEKYPVVICECTEINPDEPINNYEERGHTHILNLIDVFKQHKDKQFILIHESMKYTDNQLEEFEKKINNDNDIKVIVWSDSYAIR